jgi:hypothetical protein
LSPAFATPRNVERLLSCPIFLDQDQVEDFASVFSVSCRGSAEQITPARPGRTTSLAAPYSKSPLLHWNVFF